MATIELNHLADILMEEVITLKRRLKNQGEYIRFLHKKLGAERKNDEA